MEPTRRNFIHGSILLAGTAALSRAGALAAATGTAAGDTQPTPATTLTSQASMPTITTPPTTNILGGDKFDPAKWLLVPARTFDDLKVGDVFRAPSRTLTAAHTAEFQGVSCDTHPRHYNDDYARSHGMPAALIQPFQLLALTAPGATLFTHYVGEHIAALAGVECEFGENCYVGDTVYPALEIAELSKEGDKGVIKMTIMIFNQRGQTVLSGHQRFLLKLS